MSDYTQEIMLKGGMRVLVRPIRPDDALMEREFIARLGPESDYNRFFGYVKNPSEEMLRSLCNIDYETQMALVAQIFGFREPMIIGVGRIIKSTENKAELAVVVADEYQHLGLGTKLIEMLLDFARLKKFSSAYAAILPGNSKIINMLTEKFGFDIRYVDNQLLIAELPLTDGAPKLAAIKTISP